MPHRLRRGRWDSNTRRSGHPQHLGLSAHRQLVARIDNFLAISKLALVSAIFKTLLSNMRWPIMTCNRSRSTFCSPLARILEDAGCALQQLALIEWDLRSADIVFLPQLSLGLLTPQSL